MKIKTLSGCALAAFLFASCAHVSDVTKITGTVDNDGLDQVNIAISDLMDTLVPVTDGRFNIEVPTVLTDFGVISAGSFAVQFVPDGTELKVTLSQDAKVESASKSISVQEKFNQFTLVNKGFQQKLNDKIADLQTQYPDDKAALNKAIEEAFNSLNLEYKSYNEKAASENKDNVIALFAISNLEADADPAQVLALIDGLVPAIQNHPYIVHLKSSLASLKATAEGSMFTDFEVENVYGYTRSADPEPLYQTVKFSDYVGKGKYVLVDFWSPWCGPCKREIPNIRKVYDKYHGDDFDVLSIAVWERQPQSVTIETANELGVIWQQINNAKDIPTTIYGIQGIPHIMLIGPDGTILKRGLHGLEGIENEVAKYVKAK